MSRFYWVVSVLSPEKFPPTVCCVVNSQLDSALQQAFEFLKQGGYDKKALLEFEQFAVDVKFCDHGERESNCATYVGLIFQAVKVSVTPKKAVKIGEADGEDLSVECAHARVLATPPPPEK